MSEISTEIGARIRTYRKARNMTLDQLASIVCKGKSTLSKYEKGEIIIDIETLYDIADALEIHVEQLLYCRPQRAKISSTGNQNNFLADASQFYSYLYDGRVNRIMRCVFDVLSETAEDNYKIMMYMNFDSYKTYHNCENIYYGYIEHFDSMTNIMLTNQNFPLEKASAHILTSSFSYESKWGIWNGISTRPLMPISTKMLFSKSRLKEDDELIKQLKISKDDIRILKHYNMLSIT